MYFINTNHPCVSRVIYNSDGTIITEDVDNPIYQEYLAWIAEGNEPEEWMEEQTNAN